MRQRRNTSENDIYSNWDKISDSKYSHELHRGQALYRDGGGRLQNARLQNGKIAGPQLSPPPPGPQDRVKLFTSPNLKGGNILCPLNQYG